MKKRMFFWQTAGFVFTGIAGVLLHFLFDWTGGSVWVAPFSAVNESIWEHMKLLFFPMLMVALIQGRAFGKKHSAFWCIKLIGILLGQVLIPVLYYTINGAFGRTPDWVNIAIFFVVAAICYAIETWLFIRNQIRCKSPMRVWLGLGFLALLFVVWTFIPPQIPLFIPPARGI